MKVLACIGSYRTNGNTARIVRLIAERMREMATRDCGPLEIETLYLGHQDLRFCRGCRVCFDRGEDRCPLQDDLPAIKAKMSAADGIIVATPVYVDDVSGIVKTWIDRLAHVCHRPEFAGKSAYLVATTGGSPAGHAFRTLNTALRTWGYHVVGQAGFKTGALMGQEELQARCRDEAERIARAFLRALRTRTFTKPSFYALMIFKIQQLGWRKAASDSLDYAYWHGRGWLDPRRTFYTDHRASPIIVAVARLAGALIAPFVM